MIAHCFSLSALRGRNVVLYFYPKDNTHSCTLQAIEFSDLEEEFKRHDTFVIGISRDDCMSHANFRDKHDLAVQMLSDEDGEVCSQYGVWQEKEKDGIKKNGHSPLHICHRPDWSGTLGTI